MNYLLKHTDLQKNYNFNMIVIDERTPKQVGLKQLLQSFINHREDVITRRSEHRKLKAESRLHIVEGLVKAINVLDEIIEIIRKSENKANSKENIIKKF